MGPLFKMYHLPHGLYIVLTIIMGFFFGAVLERAGFISTRKLTGVFYFDDFAVLKVMFTAIVVAGVGLYFLGDIGVINLSKVYFPKTFWISQLVGGLLFGVGFMLSGYCPGTAVVSFASGSIDAIFVILGMISGMWIFGGLFDLWKNLYYAGKLGRVTLPDVLGLNHWIVLLIIAVMAAAMFYGAEWRERQLRDRGEI